MNLKIHTRELQQTNARHLCTCLHTCIYRITWTCGLSRPGSSRMGGGGFNDLRAFYRQSYVKGHWKWLLTGSPSGSVCSCTGYVWPVPSWWRLRLVSELVLWRVTGVLLGPGATCSACVWWRLRLCPGRVSAITCSSVGLTLVQGCNHTHSHTRTDGRVFVFFFKLWCHWPWLLFLCQHCFFVFLFFTHDLWSWFCNCIVVVVVVVVCLNDIDVFTVSSWFQCLPPSCSLLSLSFMPPPVLFLVLV